MHKLGILELLGKEKSTDIYDYQWIVLFLLLVVLTDNFT